MSEIFEDRKKALEEEYFRRKERETIEKLRAKMTAEEQARVAAAAALQCPKCAGALQPVMFEGVEIDACDKCGGVWLDANELAAVTKRDESGWFGRLFGSSDS
ncbi:MAG TPA: zf-TFIIB domain-containing protein [Pyrinomonadaceae bacterium]|jgi:hypothetical protein